MGEDTRDQMGVLRRPSESPSRRTGRSRQATREATGLSHRRRSTHAVIERILKSKLPHWCYSQINSHLRDLGEVGKTPLASPLPDPICIGFSKRRTYERCFCMIDLLVNKRTNPTARCSRVQQDVL